VKKRAGGNDKEGEKKYISPIHTMSIENEGNDM
jgi:hypothetical protein